jgi:hypothetical protein
MQYKYKTSKGEKSLNYHATRDADSAAWLISYQPAVLFSQNKPATSNQPTVLFSQNKPAPAISHQPTERAEGEERKGRGAKISHCTVLHVTVTGIRGPLLDIVLQSAVQEERTDMLVQYTLSISNYYLFDFAIHSFYFSRL